MIFSIQIDDRIYKIDTEKPIDISIPLQFNGDQPNAYGVPKATSKPVGVGDLVGDTRQGGSCNFEQYTFIPHCNGTHTECVGHITKARISVRDCLQDVFIPAVLISVSAENAIATQETYPVELNENDYLITRRRIQESGIEIRNFDFNALIIRTLPNNDGKLVQKYGEYVPPFFSNEAIELIVELGVKHLLVDLPSIDRIFDEGKLSNHRKFWNVGQEMFETTKTSRINNTITELIYVPNMIEDGNYLLNLQIAAFESDTSPSRPILFRFEN